jgi:alpha-amylase/alpha-mannosidase (GH57 family)
MEKNICIHGHFYQPPRENAWIEEVEQQDSAYPFHDWNERITAECYAPNTASRIVDAQGRIINILNNYSKISFNFGPTLLTWLEKNNPLIYKTIIESDKLSMELHSGHGSAMAQCYNHMIMPLANKADKLTQVLWGIRDFQKRYSRDPEGMWLPETAVDLETLEILAENGIKFSILSPHQAKSIRKPLDRSWTDVSGGRIDPKRPYLLKFANGKSISLFFYDGPISNDIAFGDTLTSGENFAKRLDSLFTPGASEPQLAHTATDGETYGHHHKYGDMALSYCIHYIESTNLAKLTNYSEFLAKYPPAYEVEILENTSWSCPHGVLRWKENDGCRIGANPGWVQTWRKPLRDAFDFLREEFAPFYEAEMAKTVKDPWAVRNKYIDVILDRSENNVNKFFNENIAQNLSPEDKTRIIKLLEIQRNAMLMYTSCGWFFDEISGIETIQVMQYAARAVQLYEELSGKKIEDVFKKMLAEAPSNILEFRNGSVIYDLFVKPGELDLMRVGAHYAISSLFEEYEKNEKIYCYSIDSEHFVKKQQGKLKLFIGRFSIKSNITLEKVMLTSAVIHFGDEKVNGGVKLFSDAGAYDLMQAEIIAPFERGESLEVLKLMEKHFGANNYTLWHLFKDEQRKVLKQISLPILKQIENFSREVLQNNYSQMSLLKNLHIPVPEPLPMITGYLLNEDINKNFEDDSLDIDLLRSAIKEAKKWGIKIDAPKLGYNASIWINAKMRKFAEDPNNTVLLESVLTVLMLLNSIEVGLNLWEAQNIYFNLNQNFCRKIEKTFEQGDGSVKKWLHDFKKLGNQLHIKI